MGRWFWFQTGISAINLFAGTHSAIITDGNGCGISSSSQVNQPDDLITITTPSPGDTVCSGITSTLNVDATGGHGGYHYAWSGGLPDQSTQSIIVTKTSDYTVWVSDAMNCISDIDTIHFSVGVFVSDSLFVTKGDDICEGEVSHVLASFHNNLGEYTYVWSNNLGNVPGPIFVSPKVSTTYTVTVTTSCGEVFSDDVTVDVVPAPIIQMPDTLGEGCPELSVYFKDETASANVYTYEWNFGDGNSSFETAPTHVYTQSGIYQVTLQKSSDAGCVSDDRKSHIVDVYQSPNVYAKPTPEIVNLRDGGEVQFINLSTYATDYIWYFGTLDTSTAVNPSYVFYKTGNYPIWLNAINDLGCTDSYSFDLSVINKGDILVPDAFVPSVSGGNGGIFDVNSLDNDVFFALVGDVISYKMSIYNRWGTLIFQSDDVNIGWDGYYHGELSPLDVYVWKIEITNFDHEDLVKSGSVTLLR